MSVIIRLQNLPWNANALDIRRFFQGQSIPDGGVHIIGGEKGDAFIAFSTDEDARQAMMKDGGRINGFVIKLLLSSKTEMQNVIAAAKGGPLPGAPPVASGLGAPKPVGFYDRPLAPPVGAAPLAPFIGGIGGGAGDVTASGQPLRSSTGLGNMPMPNVFPGNNSQVIPAQTGALPALRLEPRPLPGATMMPPPPARSVFDSRPSDRPLMPGNVQPPVAPVDPLAPGLRSGVPGLPPVGGWTSTQPVGNRDIPPPADFGRPAEIPGNQGVGYGREPGRMDFGRPADIPPTNQGFGLNVFNPGAGRDPGRPDSGPFDINYPRNGPGFGPPETARNFIPGIEPVRNVAGPPPDAGRDFGRVDSGRPLGHPEEARDLPRFGSDRPGWGEREGGRPEGGPSQGWGGPRPGYDERDRDGDFRRDLPRPDSDRRFPAPDRWLDSRDRGNFGPDLGPRDDLRSERGLPASGPLSTADRFGPSRPPEFSERSRFDPDSGPSGFPGDRPKGDSRGFAEPEPRFHEPPRPLMDKPLRLPPPASDRPWMEERRGLGPLPGFDRASGPRDHHFPDGGGGFPPRDEMWHGERREFDPRRMREPGPPRDLCVCVTNLPRTFNYREVRRFFTNSPNCKIPGDGVKLINDRSGMRTGVAFVHLADLQSLHAALDNHGKLVEGCRVTVERCSDEEFEEAIDGTPKKRFDRSRSPIRTQRADENSNVTYFVLKKLPFKTEKEDIRKFLGKFRIAPDGGPFFELAFDQKPTGNALVAIEEKDYSKVLSLHHCRLNNTCIDVIHIHSYEFVERSRRARQSERDPAKDLAKNKPPGGDKKGDRPDSKSKEVERGSTEDEGRRTGGSDNDQRSYCVELRGVPYTASPVMVQDFFRDINIPEDSIHIVYNREHRSTGLAYVEFASFADQKRALEKDKQHMSHRVVEVRALGKRAMVEEFNKQQQKFGGTPLPVPNPRSQTLLSMQNLHSNTQLEDILEFFSGFHPIVDSIKLQYKDGQPTGDGLIAFESSQEAEAAFRTKNRHMLLGKPITLSWPKN